MQVVRITPAQMITLLAFAALNFLDVASTHVALQSGFQEGNPIPSVLMSFSGTGAMYLFKLFSTLVVALTVMWLAPRYRYLWYALYASNAILFAVVLLNLIQLVAM